MKIHILFCVTALIWSVHGDAVWTELPQSGDIPSIRGSATMSIIDDTAVLFGGYLECFNIGACSNYWYNSTHHYNLKSPFLGKWTLINIHTGPSARGYHSMTEYKKADSVIIYGGTTYEPDFSQAAYFGDMWQYFVFSRQWVQRNYVNEGPGKRVGPGIAIVGDILYFHAGFNGENFHSYSDFWKYNLRTNRWTQLLPDGQPNTPSGRYLHKVEIVDGSFYVFSGNLNPTQLGVQLGDAWELDLDCLEWTEMVLPASIPSRVHGGSASNNRGLYFFLGDTNNDTVECKTNEISGGQLPTNRTDVYKFHGPNKGWHSNVPSVGAPQLKRFAYADNGRYSVISHGFDFVCAADKIYHSNTSLPIWNTKMYKLSLENIV